MDLSDEQVREITRLIAEAVNAHLAKGEANRTPASDLKIISLAEAKRRGLTRYFNGEPCPKGHIAERMVSNSGCAECSAAWKTAWRLANPETMKTARKNWKLANPEKVEKIQKRFCAKNREKRRAQFRSWADANPDYLRKKYAADPKKYRAKAKKWADANPEKVAAQKRRWIKENPEKNAANGMLRLARKLKATPPWAEKSPYKEQIEAVYFKADLLTKITGIKHVVDHYYPLRPQDKINGPYGLHVPANLRIITKKENSEKNNIDPRKFYGLEPEGAEAIIDVLEAAE